MPTGIYQHKTSWNKGIKGLQPWMNTSGLIKLKKGCKKFPNSNSYKKGHLVSDETRKKIGKANKGHKHSEITKKRISETNKIKGIGKWTKGRKLSEEHKKIISEANKGKTPYRMTNEIRIKMSESQKGKIISEKTRQRIREYQINHPNRKFKDTEIELKIEKELIKRNINYQKQVPLCNIAIVDFYLPEYRIDRLFITTRKCPITKLLK